ncbi:hypothetical protein OCH239_04930 [Roseivivax halodurans JCM 10272]|uniref:Flp pilus assembly protein TadG n=1 Tax=Roseivivax halodurans JCM 10272 TaxID=1449350 RepID=X7EGF8_9RHOB|nr:hypothetical protein [Roseivivax halodurans]ETX14198.1 hypothetical protein OCH239_04930 [Roseivivax halodurans JCM 10272]
MVHRIATALRRFLTRDEGDATVESVIVMPGLFFVLGALWVWHDVGRQETLEQRINYTIGDMISRETNPIDDSYIDATYNLALAMLDSTSERSDVRISVVRQTEKLSSGNQNYEIVWSEARGAREALSGSINQMSDRLPLMARNDQVIVVETWRDYTPVLEAGLLPYEIASYSFTRPRFAPQVKFGAEEEQTASAGGDSGFDDSPGGPSVCQVYWWWCS